MRWSICDRFWIYGWGWFTYDIYLVIYPTIYFSVSKIFGILDVLLLSGLVVVEVMLVFVYKNLYGIYATLCLLMLSCVDKLEFGLWARFELVSYYYVVYMFKYMDLILDWLALSRNIFCDRYSWGLNYKILMFKLIMATCTYFC